MPILEKRVPILLDKERVLTFNANTMCAYEEATGKFFLDTIASLYDIMRPLLDQRLALRRGETPTLPIPSAMEIVRKVPMLQLRALIWASCHEYDAAGDPHWPLTLSQVGRHIQLSNLSEVFTLFLKGHSANSPTEAELGESPAPSENPAAPLATPPTGRVSSGERSIELPEDALA